jgi:hypothetical protein
MVAMERGMKKSGAAHFAGSEAEAVGVGVRQLVKLVLQPE